MKICNSTIRLLGLLFLVVFVVQTTGLTCVGDDLPFSPYGSQAGYHQSGNGSASDAKGVVNSGGAGDLHQCSCHMSFTPTPPVTVTSISIFQPPESIL